MTGIITGLLLMGMAMQGLFQMKRELICIRYILKNGMPEIIMLGNILSFMLWMTVINIVCMDGIGI